jgi:hypothetical protein
LPPQVEDSDKHPATLSDNEAWNEAYDEIMNLTEDTRESTPLLVIPASHRDNRWHKLTKKIQSPISKFINTTGKKIHTPKKNKRKKRTTQSTKDTNKSKGPKVKERKAANEGTGIEKWFTKERISDTEGDTSSEVGSTSEWGGKYC